MSPPKPAFLVLLALCCCGVSPSGSLRTLDQRIYHFLDASDPSSGVVPCFRLISGTRQIGCSASSTNTRGVLYYVSSEMELEALVAQGPHPPYVAMLEPHMFTSSNVRKLKSSSRINGIVVRFNDDTSFIPEGLDYFSPASPCPNSDLGQTDTHCSSQDSPWNRNGSSLSFVDFQDFPIFALLPTAFDLGMQCFFNHTTAVSHGSLADYPLCAIELTADMLAVRDTPTCFRRAKILTALVNSLTFCDPLGDMNVWASLFELTPQSNNFIVLATKLDSTAFFPGQSYGANNELTAMATLFAVIEQLGRLKREGLLTQDNVKRPILFIFFQGESWDYIGSSRMVWDMERGEFPYKPDNSKQQPPLFGLNNITDYLELSQLGIQARAAGNPTFYLHGNKSSLSAALANAADRFNGRNSTMESVDLLNSSRAALPPSSLSRLQRDCSKREGGCPTLDANVLTDFDTFFSNRFFGSRYDNLANLNGSSEFAVMVTQLTALATIVTTAVLGLAVEEGASLGEVTANESTVAQVLECFLSDSNCSLFRSVLAPPLASQLAPRPLSRYVTVNTQTNTETLLTFQLLAYLAGDRHTNSCASCLRSFNESIQTYNTTWMSGSDSNVSECLCVTSFTHMHTALSPAFATNDYASTEYSTWAESRWSSVSIRLYLVTYPLQETAFLLCGIAMAGVAFLVAVQCTRKGQKLFQAD